MLRQQEDIFPNDLRVLQGTGYQLHPSSMRRGMQCIANNACSGSISQRVGDAGDGGHGYLWRLRTCERANVFAQSKKGFEWSQVSKQQLK